LIDSIIDKFFKYPPVGFHFAVIFELSLQTPQDFRFQEVQGLSTEIETEEFREGGENRFVHKLPKRVKFPELILKRGMFTGSGILVWCRNAIENFIFEPTNIMITLLNEYHLPVAGWYVVNAFPVQWSVTDFNAQESQAVIESIKFNYNYFTIIKI
jgi:phage tail-like protein